MRYPQGAAESLDPHSRTMKPTPLPTAVLLALLVAVPAAAAPSEGEQGGLLTPEGGLMFWTLIVFGVVLFVLYKAAYPMILGAVETREAHLARMLEEAETSRAEAAALAEEHRRTLEETRARVQEALADARGQSETMRAEVMAEARREQQELLERARRDISVEREAAMDAVRREAAVLAIAAAEKLVRRNLDAEDNRRLVRDYLDRVGEPASAGA
jgi:F-type H+-transporting ATPase subunit b